MRLKIYGVTRSRSVTAAAEVMGKFRKIDVNSFLTYRCRFKKKKFWEDPKTDATEYFDIYLTTPVNFPNLKLIKKL